MTGVTMQLRNDANAEIESLREQLAGEPPHDYRKFGSPAIGLKEVWSFFHLSPRKTFTRIFLAMH